VTDNSTGLRDDFRIVSVDDLRWLIEVAGPAFVGNGHDHDPPGEVEGTSGVDHSRSGKAWRAGAELKRKGASYAQMRDALLEHPDPDIATWARTKGSPFRERELHRIYDKVDQTDSNSTPGAIRIVPGELRRMVDEAELALLTAKRELYQRDGKIVHVSYTPALTSTGEPTTTIQILERGDNALILDLSVAAPFEKFNKRSKDWLPQDPPLLIVKALQEHGLGGLRFPILHGVITAPTMRADGSILHAPGYDSATGLLFDPRGVDFPAIPEHPPRAEAEKALALIVALIKEFPFVQPYDKSVALSTTLTACVRRSLPSAPLHAFSGPTAGTGKGKLVDIACIVATGFRASSLNAGLSEEETEKRLASKLMSGEPFISFDNCTRPLEGDLLCSMLTQEKVSPRILGHSKTPSTSTGAFVAANGNNLVIAGDLTRRTLRCMIDAKMEQPETRVFKNDPVILALTYRPRLVAAVLTILRAYHVAGRPDKPPQLGSFEAWSDLVRGALLWLGMADPVESMKELRKSDPVRESIRAVMGQWEEAFNIQNVTTAEVITSATETREGDYGGKFQFVRPDFRDVLMEVAGRGGALNAKVLGNWLESKQNTIIDGFHFVRMGERKKVAVWALKKAEQNG
jgi:putative DNA primase/helicase